MFDWVRKRIYDEEPSFVGIDKRYLVNTISKTATGYDLEVETRETIQGEYGSELYSHKYSGRVEFDVETEGELVGRLSGLPADVIDRYGVPWQQVYLSDVIVRQIGYTYVQAKELEFDIIEDFEYHNN